MLLPILYPYIKLALGTLYPAYKTWKALKRKDDTTRRRWMKYWVSIAAFQLLELGADITLAFVIPFYIELKLALILWIVMGTKLIFDSIVNRELAKREKSIDRWLGKITKVRDELVAVVWYEISRCSVKFLTAIMSGGLSVLVRSPDESNQVSPVCSDIEDTLELQDQETVHYSEPDLNENMVSMDWAAITLNGSPSSPNGALISTTAASANGSNGSLPTFKAPLELRPSSSTSAIRKSARRELMLTRGRSLDVTIREVREKNP